VCMTLFGFRHAQENTFAFLIPLALGEIAIHLRCLDLGAPISLDHSDRLLPTSPVTRWVFAFHRS